MSFWLPICAQRAWWITFYALLFRVKSCYFCVRLRRRDIFAPLECPRSNIACSAPPPLPGAQRKTKQSAGRWLMQAEAGDAFSSAAPGRYWRVTATFFDAVSIKPTTAAIQTARLFILSLCSRRAAPQRDSRASPAAHIWRATTARSRLSIY